MSAPTTSDPIDWFTAISFALIGAIVGGMLALSFAPAWVSM
jgi:hypothetical protein